MLVLRIGLKIRAENTKIIKRRRQIKVDRERGSHNQEFDKFYEW